MTAEPLWVPLDGAMNVRDLGGLPTDDGGETVRGRVLRADNLQDLTPADVRRLVDDLGVRTIVDLRTTIEVDKEGPGPLTREARVEHRHLSLYPESGGLTDVDADGEKVLPWQTDWGRAAGDDPAALNPAIGYYLAYLRHRPDSVLAALRAMAAADGTVVVHCAAGKDRTGVVVALALSAAGVRRAAVVADYVATGDRIDAVVDRLLASPTYAADLERGDAHRPRAVTMEGFLEVLDERFGGPVGWLASAGFGPGEVAALRHRLVG
jgi:protein tyrosine/serine phosphatase